MRVQPNDHGALQALHSVLLSIDSVRNARAWYLLLLGFTVAGLLLTAVMQALGRDADVTAALLAGAAFFSLFYSSNAAGLVLMDEACGREIRFPREALGDALRCAHRLLIVVACVLAATAALGALVTGLLWACRLPVVGTACWACWCRWPCRPWGWRWWPCSRWWARWPRPRSGTAWACAPCWPC